MASNQSNTKDIRYLNKDFTDLRSALIEYAKAYYPSVYNDFTVASPGSLFIDMAAYVGDVMSFYLDNQIQETFLQYSKQKENLMTMAYMLGYRPKVTAASTTNIDVYQTLPSYNPTEGSTQPDWRYALIIQEGMQLGSAGSSVSFYVPQDIDFSVSSSSSPTEISVYETDLSGTVPTRYLIKKSVPVISGLIKTKTISAPTTRTKFFTSTITDTDIIEIIDVYDSQGNRWYEVPYLAQSTIIEAKKNETANDPNYSNSSVQVPFLMEVKDVQRRFVTRFKSDNTMELQFGAGLPDSSIVETYPDEDYLPNVYKVGMGSIEGKSLLFNSYNPANFTNTRTYGLAPYNTTLTVKYLAGGGAGANVGSNQINIVSTYTSSFYGGITPDATLENQTLSSLAVNNPSASSGGSDGDTLEEIRFNTLAQFPTQMRAITEQDYLAIIYSMPVKFGKVAKSYVTKESIVQSNQTQLGAEDPSNLSAYVLTYDSNQNLTTPPAALISNLKTYLSNYRMITDSLNVKSAYVINLGLNFEITLRPDYASREVLSNCITVLKDFFNITNWQINQPILLSEVYTAIDRVPGVQTVKKVEFYNLSDANGPLYSQYGYDVKGATIDNVIYPSLDPSIFEIKFPDTDIYGKVVTF